MERLAPALKAVLTLGLALRLHHHFHGAAIDYVGLAAASFASSVGVPGPGEPVLIAAGVVAARHHLDIASVVVVAWLGAIAGGFVGWLVGLKGGRTLITWRGPLQRFRLRAVQRGEEVFARHAFLAIQLTPSWVAGIHGVRSRVYQPANVVAAAIWAFGIGLGAYYVGPPIIDLVNDAGVVVTVALVVLVLAIVGGGYWRRRRSAGKEAQGETRSAEK